MGKSATNSFLVVLMVCVTLVILAITTFIVTQPTVKSVSYKESLIACSAGRERQCNEAVMLLTKHGNEDIKIQTLLDRYHRATGKVLKLYSID